MKCACTCAIIRHVPGNVLRKTGCMVSKSRERRYKVFVFILDKSCWRALAVAGYI